MQPTKDHSRPLTANKTKPNTGGSAGAAKNSKNGSLPTKPPMTLQRARRLVEQLTKTIEEMEDSAVRLWDAPGTFACDQCDLLQFRLSERYTCRRVLQSWIRRNEGRRPYDSF